MHSRLRRRARRVGALLVAGMVAAPLGAQEPPLSLAQALREADAQAFGNRLADAQIKAERATARLPLAGILPAARVEGALVHTTDPIGAFGTRLRQRAIGPADFDPARLNTPNAIRNVQGGLVVELPLANGDAWAGWRAAQAGVRAREAAGDWTRTSIRGDVVRAYYGAILARAAVATWEEAEAAATAGVTQVEAMVRQGLVTRADALQAQVRASEVRAQRLAAQLEAYSAARQLALLLGRRDGEPLALPATLPADTVVRALAVRDTLAPIPASVTTRGDVQAARAAEQAAHADRLRAGVARLPRVNGIARMDWNAPGTPFAGRPNWTVGVMASWTLPGFPRDLADWQGASARQTAARAAAEAAEAAGTVETTTARQAIAVALERLELATLAATQAREAQRLVGRRYAGGLATIAERLGADATATGAALAHAAARHAVIDALATYRRATGGDPADLTRLEEGR